MTRIEGRTEFARTCERVLDILADCYDEPLYNRLIVSAPKARRPSGRRASGGYDDAGDQGRSTDRE